MCCRAVCAAARHVYWQELRTFASGLRMAVAALAAQLATFVDGAFVPLPLVMIRRWMDMGALSAPQLVTFVCSGFVSLPLVMN